MDGLPSRGTAVRSLELPLPPGHMPLFEGSRPLKRWRYVGVYGPELMLCACRVRIGPLRQEWWAVAEPGGRLRGRTSMRSAGVRFDGSRVLVDDGPVRIDLTVEEDEGVETVCPHGERGWVWTRKQAGRPARGVVELSGRRVELNARAVVDETAGYHERSTSWSWSAGVGRAESGESVGWNLVTGVNDPPKDSERSVWVDGSAVEPGPVDFASDLSSVSFQEGGTLRFTEWAAREDRINLLVVRSEYRQPFGEFSGELPGGLRLAAGYGVMERHDVRW